MCILRQRLPYFTSKLKGKGIVNLRLTHDGEEKNVAVRAVTYCNFFTSKKKPQVSLLYFDCASRLLEQIFIFLFLFFSFSYTDVPGVVRTASPALAPFRRMLARRGQSGICPLSHAAHHAQQRHVDPWFASQPPSSMSAPSPYGTPPLHAVGLQANPTR